MNRIVLGVALAMSLGLAGSSKAEQYFGPAYGGFGSGWCGGGWSYGLGYREELPHFALYPPVYYSLPVPRTYGYSPFAYPPGVMTPEIVEDKSETIINPHVPNSGGSQPESSDQPTGLRVTSNVRVIHNPYVTPTDGLVAK
jgi:hypothetical protein